MGIFFKPKTPRPPRYRGLNPTPRPVLARIPRFLPKVQLAQLTIWFPQKLSPWNNLTMGCCVSSEEAFAKATASPEIFITDATLLAWTDNNGFTNGATLPDVMDVMIKTGIIQGSSTYTDGPYSAVNFSDSYSLMAALSLGPVKLGVASDQLDNIVERSSGWYGTGFLSDSSEDHCVSCCGIGSLAFLAQQIQKVYGVSVSFPAGTNLSAQGVAIFTWGTVGILDMPSLNAITSEAYIRTPTNLVNGVNPNPAPNPIPDPVPPPPAPVPLPPGLYSITGNVNLTPATSEASSPSVSFSLLNFLVAIATAISNYLTANPPGRRK